MYFGFSYSQSIYLYAGTIVIGLVCTKTTNNSAYEPSWPCSTLVTFTYLTFARYFTNSAVTAMLLPTIHHHA